MGLVVENLSISFRTDAGEFNAVDQISFAIESGESVGLVGESGSGKTITALAIMGLIQKPGRISGGEILVAGEDVCKMKRDQLRKIRGKKIGMIFQEPMTSLNPVFKVGEQIAEVFRIHQRCSRDEAKKKSVEMLELVKIPAARQRAEEYPHQLSGGMRQRVMIAMALACKPELLIADEPTTALDVTIQAQILKLLRELQHDLGMALLLITHDLGVVAEACERVMVMYGGRIVEQGLVKDVFAKADHPYTTGLIHSIPRIGARLDVLPSIPGQVPSLGHFPEGCRFQTRCPKVVDRCRSQVPALEEVAKLHKSACWVSRGHVHG